MATLLRALCLLHVNATRKLVVPLSPERAAARVKEQQKRIGEDDVERFITTPRHFRARFVASTTAGMRRSGPIIASPVRA